MTRILAFVGSAVLLIVAGIFLWRDRADAEPAPPPPPAEIADSTAGHDEPPVPPRATERSREERRFDRYDKDRNDGITREEYLRSRRTAFGKLDANGDGRLSFDEWAAKTTAKFAGADRDRSGVLTRAEFATTRVVRRTPTRTAARCDCPAPSAGDD